MSLTILALLAVLTGCVEDVGTDKVHAVVEDVQPTQKQPAPAATGQVWTVDPAQSSLEALGAKVSKKHPIVFHEFSGEVTMAGGSASSIRFTVDMASLEADHPKLTKHLKDEDFFDVPAHPTSTFESSTVLAGSDVEGMTHTVSGALTIRGATKQITFPAKIDASDDRVSARTEFTIDRQDFGVTYPGRPDDLVQDNVVMTISLVAAPSA